MKRAHKLKTLRIEFELNSKDNSKNDSRDKAHAHAMQNKMSQLCRQYFIPAIDELCSRFSPGDQVHRIDRLEIDLGEFTPSTSEYTLKPLFERRCEESLFRHFMHNHQAPGEFADEAVNQDAHAHGGNAERSKTTGDGSAQDSPDVLQGKPERKLSAKQQEAFKNSDQREKALVSYFLQTGLLPWWCDRSDAADLTSVINRVLTSSDVVQRVVLEQPDALQRVLLQFNAEQLDYLLDEQANYLGSDFARFLKRGVAFFTRLESAGSLSLRKYKAGLWQQIIRLLRSGSKAFDESALMAAMINDWHRQLDFGRLLTLIIRSQNKLKSEQYKVEHKAGHQAESDFYARVCDYLKISNTTKDQAKILAKLESERQAKSDFYAEICDYLKISDKTTDPAKILAKLESRQRSESDFYAKVCDYLKINNTTKDQAKILAKLESEQHTSQFTPNHSSLLSSSISSSLSSQRAQQLLPQLPQLAETFDNAEFVYVANGGLALISELIGSFFIEQGLIEADNFVSEHAQMKAIAMLHYVSCGADEYQEYDLPLNKLICGLPLVEPLACDIELDSADKTACDQLVEKAIDSFADFKDASIKEVREFFLQRPASLGVRDRCWLLRIEPEGRDMLLEDFPRENLSIHYPWMLDAIVIEWTVD